MTAAKADGAELTAAQLHQLYRDYCIAKFPYDQPSVGGYDRDAHIDYDARSYYVDGEDEEGQPTPGHVGPLAELVKAAFQMGRESLGNLIAADERPAYRTVFWADDGDSWAMWSSGPDRGTPTFEREVVADAEGRVGPWDGTCRVIRTEVQRFREVTYRDDMTVLGRFGDWSEVPDAD